MAEWYRIPGSTFDADMNISEMAINFRTSEEVEDAQILYKYYSGRAEQYWIKFNNALSFNTLEEYSSYYSSAPSYLRSRYDEKIKIYFRKLQNIKKDIEHITDYYSSYLKKMDEAYNKLIPVYSVKNPEKLSRYKEKFRSAIMDVFSFLSMIFCGKYDDDVRNREDSYPLPNDSGWFSYNSYMYALSNDVTLIGVPSRISDYDGMVDCPEIFLEHDFTHGKGGARGKIGQIRSYYEDVMSSEYQKNQKEACIFTLWFVYHELNDDARYVNIPYISGKLFLHPGSGMYGVRLNRLYWEKVLMIANEYINKLNNPNALEDIVNYINGDLIPEEEDETDFIEANMTLIYGTLLLETLHEKHGTKIITK